MAEMGELLKLLEFSCPKVAANIRTEVSALLTAAFGGPPSVEAIAAMETSEVNAVTVAGTIVPLDANAMVSGGESDASKKIWKS